MLAFIARLIYYKDSDIPLNLVIIKYTIPVQGDYTYFMMVWQSGLGCQEPDVSGWNLEVYTKSHDQLCFKWVLKWTDPFFEEGLAQKKQELVELHPVRSDPLLRTLVSKGPSTSECWLTKVPV